MKARIITAMVLASLIFWGVFRCPSKGVQTYVPEVNDDRSNLSFEEQGVYDLFQQYIDDGDYVGFAELLLNDKVSAALFSSLLEEDDALVDTVILDAMIAYAESGQLDKLVQLRRNGYISDECFLNYWEITGDVLPDGEQGECDSYLLHELKLAYERDSYVLRSLMEMRSIALIDDQLHLALVERLGFDYTNLQWIEENNLSPLIKLTRNEKIAYDAILESIDNGDCMGVIEILLAGEVGQSVYNLLQDDDAELMDFVIAQGMGFLTEENRYQDLVKLRVHGFVSDSCFEDYWLMTDSGAIDRLETYGTFYDTDMFLLCELEEIARTIDTGPEIVTDILDSGLLSEATHYAVCEQLEFDKEK